MYERFYTYFSQAEMDRFVGETTWQLYRVYQLLWEEEVTTSGYSPALELPLNLEAKL